MIKVSIKDDIILGNTYVHNIKALKYIKQILTDIREKLAEIQLQQDFNTQFILIDRYLRQKIHRDDRTCVLRSRDPK